MSLLGGAAVAWPPFRRGAAGEPVPARTISKRARAWPLSLVSCA